MSDLSQQPLKGLAVYNPHLLSRQELIDLFLVRKQLLDRFLEDLRATAGDNAPQHHLILGQRGMGKTTLLRRLQLAMEEDPVLSSQWLALSFPEEQYNIARLSDFWLNCCDALSDTLERLHSDEAKILDERMDLLRGGAEEPRARQALALLLETAGKLNRRLVLLVDNIDLIFERIKQQDWAFREALSSQPSLVLIGASASAVESTYDYEQAFYDFFQVHELKGLSLEETRDLLRHYARIQKTPEVARITEQEPSRIRMLHNLTGGNPRTIALLFNVLALGVEGDVRSDLERLLDQCTPLYKARFEALSPQAQQIVHELCVYWDPISAGELAERAGLEVNAVSSQLNRLVKQGIVEKVDYDPASKIGFQVAERFFNIWYLMRASRRVRRRLVWLIEFLKIFYSQDQLRTQALAHIQSGVTLDPSGRLRYAEYSFALAEAIPDRAWSSSLEKSGLNALLRDDALRSQLPELIDLEGTEPDLKEIAEQRQRFEQTRSKVISLHLEIPGWSGEDFWTKLSNSLQFPWEVKARIADNLANLKQEEVLRLKSQLDEEPKVLRHHYGCPKTVDALAKAVQTGLMTGPIDVKGAAHAESVFGVSGMNAIALANLLEIKPNRRLLSALWETIETTTSPFPWFVWLRRSLKMKNPPRRAKLDRAVNQIVDLANGASRVILDLGDILIQSKRLTEAEIAFRQHLASHHNDARVWFELGTLLARWMERYEEAETALRTALTFNSSDVSTWVNLGITLARLGRHDEAEQVFRKAVEIEPEDVRNWRLLGSALRDLGHYEEAEKAFRKAIDLNEAWHDWLEIGNISSFSGQFERAEEAYRRAIELEPEEPFAWANLGFFMEQMDRYGDAEQSLRKALELAPDLELAKIHLVFLLLRREAYESAEAFAKEIPDSEEQAGIHASLLVRKGDWGQATEPAKRFITWLLDHDLKGSWGHTLIFFREAVSAGMAREAAQILDEIGASERWRPLRAALEAAARGNRSSLRRVAPEVRQPAEEILEQLLASPVHDSAQVTSELGDHPKPADVTGSR